MMTLKERIRADVFSNWMLALHTLREIRSVDYEHQVLTKDEKLDLVAGLHRYSRVSDKYNRIVEDMVERGEEPKTVRVNLHAVIFSYYCQSDIAERLRWCPPLRWVAMRLAARVLSRVFDRIDRDGWR